jgi:CBS domain containing-hemolysin-like protein
VTVLALVLLGIAVTLVGAMYELSLLAVSQAELTEAIDRRLRGSGEPLRPLADRERELAAAAATTSLGIVFLGALFPSLLAGDSAPRLLLLLVLFAAPFALLSGYLLPGWISHGRAEHVVAVLRPVLRPWTALLRFGLPAPADSGRELRALGRESAAVLPEVATEMAMVGSVLTFSTRPVREVMTPRTELIAVPDGASVAEITRAFAESGYSRLPVYRETLDEIVGMVHAFDLFKLQPGEAVPVRPITLTPASRSCGDLLLDMQRERRHLAVALDEFGGTLGIVTLEDLLTALVGEIYDEAEGTPALAEGARPGLLETDGGITIEEIEARFGVTFPEGHTSTLAGRVSERLGRIPAAGERLLVSNLEIDILQAGPTRVDRVVIRLAPLPPVSLEGGGR